MNEKFTNISTEPINIIDGFKIKPCMKSGFCCTTTPCIYGKWNSDKSACKYLGIPNKLGQRDCGRYDWIKKMWKVMSIILVLELGAACLCLMKCESK